MRQPVPPDEIAAVLAQTLAPAPPQPSRALTAAKWIGTCAGVAGAALIAANVGLVAYGFALFLVSSTLWTGIGIRQREPSLAVLHGSFTVINLLGLWRWLF